MLPVVCIGGDGGFELETAVPAVAVDQPVDIGELTDGLTPFDQLRACSARATGSAISRRMSGLRSTSMTPAACARSLSCVPP
jgi:hypothetical protein